MKRVLGFGVGPSISRTRNVGHAHSSKLLGLTLHDLAVVPCIFKPLRNVESNTRLELVADSQPFQIGLNSTSPPPLDFGIRTTVNYQLAQVCRGLDS